MNFEKAATKILATSLFLFAGAISAQTMETTPPAQTQSTTSTQSGEMNNKGTEALQTYQGIEYVSGGVSEESRNSLSAMSKDFNLKLVFTGTAGAYLSDVSVVALKGSKKVLDATSQGPWLFTKLPAGTYTVKATAEGKTKSQKVTVGNKLKTVQFRWATDL